ncbi:hypothetical protein PAXRUDRAFT_830175 [Paxillus rubicundulus Ve08.2h10]|uniref:Uncharacterized protein n=1 Tax=Paxillus rubicundulus Ve08.2h10 TaxID=930991 RepID=A0A0D0DLL4_9AGAM|nr:hypothetical protein PAXRUDRAFT_830175 [Paxillus rubicundulus Ve08.2h10]
MMELCHVYISDQLIWAPRFSEKCLQQLSHLPQLVVNWLRCRRQRHASCNAPVSVLVSSIGHGKEPMVHNVPSKERGHISASSRVVEIAENDVTRRLQQTADTSISYTHWLTGI